MKKNLQVFVDEDLIKALEARVSPGANVLRTDVARTAMTRYFALIDGGRGALRGKFSPEELSLLADITAGSSLADWRPATLDDGHPPGPSHLVAEVGAAESAYFAKWDVERARLIRKLDSLSVAEELALVDALECYWRGLYGADPGSVLD